MAHGVNANLHYGQNYLTFFTWPWPRPMLNWPMLGPCAHVTLKWYILHNPGRRYDKRDPAQSPEVHSAEGPTLGLWTDLDLTRDLRTKILSAHLKRLVANFPLPPRPSSCGYRFSSYRLGAFNAPPPSSKWFVAKYPTNCWVKPQPYGLPSRPRKTRGR